MGGEDWIELKFRLADGTDIGPSKYSPSMTVSSLKEKIISQWPKDSEYIPLSVNDVKLITAGQILDNNRTLAESRLPVGVISTMHLLLPPPTLHKKIGTVFNTFGTLFMESSLEFSCHCGLCSTKKLQVDPQMKNRCVCTIL